MGKHLGKHHTRYTAGMMWTLTMLTCLLAVSVNASDSSGVSFSPENPNHQAAFIRGFLKSMYEKASEESRTGFIEVSNNQSQRKKMQKRLNSMVCTNNIKRTELARRVQKTLEFGYTSDNKQEINKIIVANIETAKTDLSVMANFFFECTCCFEEGGVISETKLSEVLKKKKYTSQVRELIHI